MTVWNEGKIQNILIPDWLKWQIKDVFRNQ